MHDSAGLVARIGTDDRTREGNDMVEAAPVSTMTIRALYLEQRWPPSVIARHLGTTDDVVKSRLKVTGAMTDPRAAQPFRRPRVKTDPPEYTLAGLLREWITKDGRSIAAVGAAAGMRNSSLNRVVLGQRGLGAENCGTVARALSLDATETDRLYVAAGHAPPTLVQLGGWTDALACFCRAQVEEEG
jgi:hypothetical protein